MDVYIRSTEDITEEDSFNLQQLANLVEKDCEVSVQIKKEKSQTGTKDGGLTIGIAIVSLGLAAIGTLINVLSFWKSQQPKYSVEIIHNNSKISVDNIKPEQLQEVLSKIEANKAHSDMNILVSRTE